MMCAVKSLIDFGVKSRSRVFGVGFLLLLAPCEGLIVPSRCLNRHRVIMDVLWNSSNVLFQVTFLRALGPGGGHYALALPSFRTCAVKINVQRGSDGNGRRIMEIGIRVSNSRSETHTCQMVNLHKGILVVIVCF